MTASEYVAARTKYRYPAVGLTGTLSSPKRKDFASTCEMDRYHYELLTSEDNDRTILGYLSTVFWGFCVDNDREPRALERARMAFGGRDRVKRGKPEHMKGVKDFGIDVVAGWIRAAYAQLQEDHYCRAIELLLPLPQVRLAFASKVCAFLTPAKCGVIDSVIARCYPDFGFSVNDRGFLDPTSAHKRRYASYCYYLQKQAEVLNSLGDDASWKDRDNCLYPWRAVDVERALYQARAIVS
jgi:hypothetical protein